MRRPTLHRERMALLLVLLAVRGHAAIAFVSDELILGVYTEPDSRGQRLATLHSGATLETLGSKGESTQVRLPDGVTGWVKTSFLMAREPATLRVKRLEADLDQARAMSPGAADAAQRSEMEHMREDLAATQAQMDAMSRGHDARSPRPTPWVTLAATVIALVVGFFLGYATLARRVRQKFGGIKVY